MQASEEDFMENCDLNQLLEASSALAPLDADSKAARNIQLIERLLAGS